MSTETTEQETTETGLSIVPKITAVTFFSAGGSTSVLETLKKGIRAEAAKLDISTLKGRQAIISLAASVATAKNKLEKAGKALVADEKERLKLVDKERGIVWDEMEALQKEVRQPVTDWEQADAKRTAALDFKIVTMTGFGTLPLGATTADIEARIAEVNELDMTNMQEFTSRAELVEKTTREYLANALAQSKARDAQAAELARLQAEEVARKQRENEERIRLEAQQEAERRAEVERQRIEQERNEADARAKQEEARRVAAEAQAARDAEDAEARRVEEAKQAEERRIAAEKRAAEEVAAAERRHAEELKNAEEKRQREAKEAEERAKNAREAAVEAERVRVANEARKAQEEATKRENNRKHAAKVNGEVLAALMQHGMISEDQARAIVTALAKGIVPHTKISY